MKPERLGQYERRLYRLLALQGKPKRTITFRDGRIIFGHKSQHRTAPAARLLRLRSRLSLRS